jgi:peptide/nickel transport system substrate-binding protein
LVTRLTQPDPLTYIFEIRRDAWFHDGRQLTEYDVLYTYRSVMDPAVGSPKGGMTAMVASVDKTGPWQVTFRLSRPYAPFLSNLEFGIVAQRHVGPDGRVVDGQFIGAGPFKLARLYDDGALLLSAHDRWHGAGPHVPHVLLRPVRDDNSRLLALMAGAGHLIQNQVSPLLLPMLQARDDIRVETGPSAAISYLGFNLDDPVLHRTKVRQAIAHAIDRKAIVERKYAGRAKLATGLLAPGHWAYEPHVPRYPFDPDRARTLLDEAGLIDPDGDGPEPRARLSLKTTTNRFRRAVALVIAHQLGQVGLKTDVRAYEWGTFFHDVKSGNFQLYTLQWPVVVEPDMAHWIFHSGSIPTLENRGKGGNRGRYRNPAVDALIEAGRTETDPVVRRGIYSKVQHHLAQDLPYVFLWHDDHLALVRKELQGWNVLPTGRLAGLTDLRWDGP